ncbi:glycosyl hydrolase, partial [Hymenobacter glacieicola]|uniref:glycosyl hydrolase n=1 Tax=Hymenobacter glacieicola TaxID=1562124 RepID=UPI001E48C003
FTGRQKLHYATLPLYFLSGLVTLIDIAVPIASLFLSVYPWHIALDAFFLHLAPLLGIGLLIRYKAQQWLREPQEMGLHLAGGILRVGTWWVYLLGLVYTFLRVRVPYIPTPKEGNTRNELKICLPNILTIVLCAVAVKYAGRVDWSPYSRLMAFLATSNAAILFAAVGMGQHTWVRNMLNDFSTRPLSGLVTAGQKIVQTLTVRTQTAGISLAASSLLLVGGIDTAQYIEKQLTGLSAASWVVNGDEKLHLGVQQAVSSPALPIPFSSFTTHRLLASYSSESAPAMVGLPMTDKVPTDEMATLYEQGSIPLLTWTVTGASVANWPQMAQAFKTLNRPVLLRPVLPALPPDQYRKAWHQLVHQFQDAEITRVVWVWTPPAATAVQAYFPGKKYVDWVAIDKEETGISGQNFLATYLPYRHEFAANLALHDKPVMLLGADQRFKNRRQAELITQRFPEIKAIILHAEEHPRSTRLLTSRMQSSLNAVSSN